LDIFVVFYNTLFLNSSKPMPQDLNFFWGKKWSSFLHSSKSYHFYIIRQEIYVNGRARNGLLKKKDFHAQKGTSFL